MSTGGIIIASMIVSTIEHQWPDESPLNQKNFIKIVQKRVDFSVRVVKEQGKGFKRVILETAKYPTKPIKLKLDDSEIGDLNHTGEDLEKQKLLLFGTRVSRMILSNNLIG